MMSCSELANCSISLIAGGSKDGSFVITCPCSFACWVSGTWTFLWNLNVRWAHMQLPCVYIVYMHWRTQQLGRHDHI